MVRRRPIILLTIAGALVALVRRRKAAKAERDLWTEATSAPDLR